MRLCPLIVPIGLLAASLHAQSTPCLSYNDGNSSVSNAITATPFVGQNPSSRAYQFTPTSGMVVQSATIFTGSPIRDDFMRVEIWDEDPATLLPGTRQVVGTFASPMSATARWRGANFDTAYVLGPGINYWFVWIESGSSIVPEEPGGQALPLTIRTATNAWSTTPRTGAVKFRLYCNLLDDLTVSNFGAPARTSGNALPTAFTTEDVTAGSAGFGIEGTNLPAGANTWLLFGVDPNATSTPLGPLFPAGAAQHTDIIVALGGVTGVAEIGDQPSSPRPSPFGHIRFDLPLTGVPTGVFFAGQLIAADSGFTVLLPLVTTNAVRVVTR